MWRVLERTGVEGEAHLAAGGTYLDELVPAGGDNHGVLGVGAEANAASPLGVALLGDGVLAVTKSVPELDGAVAGAGHNLTVVGREGDGEHIVSVANESAGGGAGSKLPEAEGLVPGGREGVSTVGRDHLFQVSAGVRSIINSNSGSTYTVGDDVGVALERSLGVAVLGLVAGEVPDDEGLVSRGGEQHVRAIERSVLGGMRRACWSSERATYFSIEVAKLVTQPFCDYMSAWNSITISWKLAFCRGRETYMALQGALEDQLLSHGDDLAERRDATDVKGANATSSGEVEESKEREVEFLKPCTKIEPESCGGSPNDFGCDVLAAGIWFNFFCGHEIRATASMPLQPRSRASSATLAPQVGG